MSILVVEDDPGLRVLLQTLAIRNHLTVDAVSRGDQAKAAIDTTDYTAIVLDLMIPGMTGLDVLRNLSTTKPELLSRIIVLTAASRPVLENFEFSTVIWELIRKPFDIELFTKSLLDCVAFHTPRRAPLAEGFSDWLAERSRAVGAKAAVVVVTAEQKELQLLAAYGYAGGMAEAQFPLPLSGNFPLCSCVRTGRPAWLASLTLSAPEYPLPLPLWTLSQSQAIATIPIKRAGAAIGAIGWSFLEPQPFEEAQRTALLEIPSDCSSVVDRYYTIANHRRAAAR
jgi:DNA-binding response OmpR family regulator